MPDILDELRELLFDPDEVDDPFTLIGVDDLDAAIAEIERLRAEVAKWKRIRTPSHGPCCTCQACGEHYDDCRCDLDDVADDLEQSQAEIERLRAVIDQIHEVLHGPVDHVGQVIECKQIIADEAKEG